MSGPDVCNGLCFDRSRCNFARAALGVWLLIFTISSATRVSAVPLLPDLVVWDSVQRNYMYGGFISTTLIKSKVVYRFNGALLNIGQGPLEVREVTDAEDTQTVYQRIYDSVGGAPTESILGVFPGAASIPPRHLWLPGIAQYKLRAVTPGNGVGEILSSNDKTSMAVVDSDRHPSPPTNSPTSAVYNQVNAQILGISIGWADVYTTGLPGQWADATLLPSGQYWLEVTVDPYDRILESDETNNTMRILVNLTIPSPQIHPGDYNDDGVVDAADYTVWRDTHGQSVAMLGTGADGDGNGTIGPPDYDVWKLHFGETAGSGSASIASSVPEPSGVALAALTVFPLVRRRKKR
jgi:hypothetical protein